MGKSTAEITNLVMERFQVSKALKKRGVTLAERKKEWLEENPIHGRRPELSQVASDFRQALIDLTTQCWADNAMDRSTFSDYVRSFQTTV